MKKFLIKKHCEATEKLTIATDRVQDYYGDFQSYLSRNFLPSDDFIETFGYDSEEDAYDRLNYMEKLAYEENLEGLWNIKVELIEVEV